eukprot:gene5957-12026_t
MSRKILCSILALLSIFLSNIHSFKQPGFQSRIGLERRSVPDDEIGYFRLPSESDNEKETEPGIRIPAELDPEDSYQFYDKDIEARVLRQMELAFDNLPLFEVKDMFGRLWLAGSRGGPMRDSCLRLIKFTVDAEEIENEAERREASTSAYNGMDELYDAIRVVRSNIRMYGKDADFCSASGEYKPVEFKWPWEKSNK